jgi:hypothetical protein
VAHAVNARSGYDRMGGSRNESALRHVVSIGFVASE